MSYNPSMWHSCDLSYFLLFYIDGGEGGGGLIGFSCVSGDPFAFFYLSL